MFILEMNWLKKVAWSVVFLAVVVACFVYLFLDNEKVTTYQGIDVSHYQGDLLENIDKHDGIDFVIVKATQGTHFVDPKFFVNWSTLKRKHYLRGAYHFYFDAADPIKQANHFHRTLNDFSDSDIAPIVDVERGGEGDANENFNSARFLKFLRHVELKFGRVPYIYSNYSFANQHLVSAIYSRYPLWLADYTGDEVPKIPNAWQSVGYRIWQKSNRYSIKSKLADFDVFHGKRRDLIK